MEMAKELNMYFASILTVEDASSIMQLQDSQGTEVTVVAITKEKVLGKLRSPKVENSPRADALLPRVLKEIAEDIVEALVVIFQESL
eukprot:g39904.t1